MSEDLGPLVLCQIIIVASGENTAVDHIYNYDCSATFPEYGRASLFFLGSSYRENSRMEDESEKDHEMHF